MFDLVNLKKTNLKKVLVFGATMVMAVSTMLSVGAASEGMKVIISKDSKVYHTKKDCPMVAKLARARRKTITKTQKDLTKAGYHLCKSCALKDEISQRIDFFLDCEDEEKDDVDEGTSKKSDGKELSETMSIE